jgi:hypothetical protein
MITGVAEFVEFLRRFTPHENAKDSIYLSISAEYVEYI